MRKELADARESMYLLSIEIMILYLVAFGMLSLKTDNMFSVGMAYPAVLITFLLAYLLPVLALVSGLLGFEHSYRAAMRSALGAAVFVCVAFLVLAVLVMSLWSSPLICVYIDDASADCHVKGDTVSLRIAAADVRFGYPSRAQYLDHTALANASVADVFLKASLTENDWVAKVHAIIAMSVAFLLLVVQSSFFYAVYGATDDAEREAFTGADLASLFVRCFLLLLCVVIDSADFFADWNVVDVGPQMLPSLAFLCVLILSDFCDTIIERRLDSWHSAHERQSKLRVLVCVAETGLSSVYTLFAILIACHYLVGGFAPLREFIVDTRMTPVHILFVIFLLLDSWSVFARVLLKVRRQLQHPHRTDMPQMHVDGSKTASSFAHASETPAFGASIDLKKVVFITETDKKTR
jgi:hypothetical protein